MLNNEPTDKVPFHPIVMRWAAKYNNVVYSKFCTVPEVKCKAMAACSRDFGFDWVTVMSDPWAEASAFGIKVDYPEDGMPIDRSEHFNDAASVARLQPFDPLSNERCFNRLEELRIFRDSLAPDLFKVGWVEGPVAEYVDLRKASEASLDFCLDPAAVSDALDIITESAIRFIELQIEAGADCIGIGDAFCSQIGPEMYLLYAFERERKLVEHIHKCGAVAKLHICGDTSAILPHMIKTGADIIDIDHMVKSFENISGLTGPRQVFCGKSDPVSVISNGDRERIRYEVHSDWMASRGRYIASAGCEITPETTTYAMRFFSEAASLLPV